MTAVPRRERADAERNRQRVMDAATLVFAETGHDATLVDVARAAGVGVGTVYRKFADKDALLDALFDDKLSELTNLARTAAREPDSGASFRGLLMALMEKRASDRGLDAILTTPERNRRFAQELGREFLPVVAEIVDQGIADGEVRETISADEVCVLAWLVGKVADITKPSDPEVWRRYAQLVIDGTRPQLGEAILGPLPLSFAENTAALARANEKGTRHDDSFAPHTDSR